MDEHEMRAYELEVILIRTSKTYKMVPAYATALKVSIENHRSLSQTYRRCMVV